jgi:anti-anti-sigma factor
MSDMMQIITRPGMLWAQLPAELEAVDELCGLLREWLAARRLEAIAFAVELLAREGLTNAVMHGSVADRSSRVELACSVGGGVEPALTLRVTDGGAGFDWRSLIGREIPAEAEGGRGFRILEAYADSFAYNDRGNELTMVKGIPPEVDMASVTQEGNTLFFKPGGDVVASVVDGLRAELRKAMEGFTGGAVVDLTGTQIVDSKGLGLIVALHNTVAKQGGKLSVVNASPDIVALFTLMRLNQHFTVSAR